MSHRLQRKDVPVELVLAYAEMWRTVPNAGGVVHRLEADGFPTKVALAKVEQLGDPEERSALASRLRHEIGRRRRAAEASAGPRIVRTEKRCPGCSATKPVSEFGRNAARPDGLQSLCRKCR